MAEPPKMKEAAGASPDDPATSDMVSGRKLQPGRPCGPLCFGLAPLIGGGYLPRALRSEGFRSRPQLSGASPERTEPTPLLNHETSDHLLSLVEEARAQLDTTT